MVEYSAFNRFVPGSNPGQSIRNQDKITFFKNIKVNKKNNLKLFINLHKKKEHIKYFFIPPGEFESPLPP